ncbi:CBO0543 family protein [Paucisalibacillus sp. EB02]|uniref:CBO0543 family protein n=1 Tax=Paucisalibacillus sp. EB02 TaxID=1347087 RepID=UPI0018CC01CE|nr:CBO0543 family protein [Paucisalibacillus sp. EB02]
MSKRLEKTVELSAWGVMALLLIKFVPKNRIREAQVAFLFKQLITWLFGLLVVEKNLISYPYRLFFKKTIKSSFTFEYFVYPGLCALFNLYYPEKRNYFIKLLYYFFHSGVITTLEVILLKYTNLIKYKKWTWYWSIMTMWFTNYLSHIYFKWFFKEQVNYQQK